MKKLILRTANLVVQLICAIIEALAVGLSIACMKVYDLCERIEERSDHAVNETVCKMERQAYTREDGFVHPDYEEL